MEIQICGYKSRGIRNNGHYWGVILENEMPTHYVTFETYSLVEFRYVPIEPVKAFRIVDLINLSADLNGNEIEIKFNKALYKKYQILKEHILPKNLIGLKILV